MWLVRVFLFNATAPTDIYTLSLHDALPISRRRRSSAPPRGRGRRRQRSRGRRRSEEHTSELQSLRHLVCRLLLEKKKERRRDRRAAPDTTDRGDDREGGVQSKLDTRENIAA